MSCRETATVHASIDYRPSRHVVDPLTCIVDLVCSPRASRLRGSRPVKMPVAFRCVRGGTGAGERAFRGGSKEQGPAERLHLHLLAGSFLVALWFAASEYACDVSVLSDLSGCLRQAARHLDKKPALTIITAPDF